MAKAETRDYFRTTIDQVDQAQLGALSVLLAKAGFTQVRHELVTDVLRYKNKQTHDVKAEDFLIDWMADHKEFQAREAVHHFREAGRTNGACYTALRVLVKRKLLRKLGEGRYSMLAPREAPKKAKAAKKAKKHHDIPARPYALRLASRNHGRFNSLWLKRQFEADGRHPSGTGPVINRLLKDKQIKRVGEGEYVLLAKAKKPMKVNGAAAPAEVAANG